jgi:hypothetical protein
MSLTLTITDNADGTGGVATIDGTWTGGDITLHCGRFDGEIGAVMWFTETDIPGNLSVPIVTPWNIGKGHFWAYGESADGLFGLQYFAFTNGNDAVQYQALYAVQSRLRLLLLSGIASSSIVVKKLPVRRLVKELIVAMPAILITPAKGSMNPTAGTNALDDPVYAVLLTIVEADNQDVTVETNLERHTKWHEQIERAFQNQRLPGVTEIYNCAVEPQEPISLPEWMQQLYTSSILLKFTARVPRGLNA